MQGAKRADTTEAIPEASEKHAGRWNAVRCAEGALGGHVESYFLKLNDPNGRQALWLKATILVRQGGAPRLAQAWAVSFDREGRHVAAKQTVPLSDASFGTSGLRVSVADLALVPGRVSGAVASGDRRIAFDLGFTMDAQPLIPFPSERMYEGRLPSFKIMTPHPDSRFTGSYSVDGETVKVDGWRGMQGHNWGARHSQSYAWGHVNQWEGHDDLVVEGFTARVKVGPILAPPLTVICVRHDGVRYDFNAPLAMVRAGRPIELGRWAFSSKNAHATVTGELWAEPRDFVGLAYENPDGSVSYCLNSKIARGRVRLSIRGRPDVEAMTRSAALEILTPDPNHGITMHA